MLRLIISFRFIFTDSSSPSYTPPPLLQPPSQTPLDSAPQPSSNPGSLARGKSCCCGRRRSAPLPIPLPETARAAPLEDPRAQWAPARPTIQAAFLAL